MSLIDEQTVDSELFKGQRIVLICFFEPIELLLQTLTGTLHSLDLELRAFALFEVPRYHAEYRRSGSEWS